MPIEEFLKSLKLEKYIPLFLNEEIENTTSLQLLYDEDELTDEYLDETLKLKKIAKIKLLKALQNKNELWYITLSNNNNLWNEQLLNSEVAIISHEYNRIKKLLSSGQYFGVLLQIKDFFEILLKLPVLIVINEKFNKRDNSTFEETAFIMAALEKPLSLGHWHELATSIKKNILIEGSSISSLINNIVILYNKYDLIKWRNDEIGHGALSLDDDPAFQKDIENKLQILNDFIHKNIDYLKDINFEKDKGIIGYGNNLYSSSPFFDILDQKIYLFDSYLSRKEKTHQLNYCFGKKIVTSTPDFKQFIAQINIEERDKQLCLSSIEDVRLAAEERQLDLLEKSTLFIEPTHLTDWLRNSLKKFTKGRLLLQMQRGTGKSLFSKALDQLSLNKIKLEEDMLVRAYYINDIFRNSISDFTSEISFFIMNKKLAKGNLEDVFKGQIPNLTPDSKTNDFAFLLNWYKQKYDVQKLIFIIDGVDEIPKKDEKSIFDILPETSELNEGIYLLVTARTDEEITDYTREQLNKISFEDKRIVQKDSIENINTLKNYIGKYKLANSDIQIDDLIQKADYRILYLNMLKEILLSCKVQVDDIPSNEQIIDFYLEEIKKKYGEKYFQTIFAILIILASQLEELTIKEIAYLNNDSSVSLKLIANLFDLRGFIKKTRNETGNKFSLNHIVLTHYLNKHYKSEIINYLQNIYQDINTFSSEDEADIYKMAYLEQYEIQYSITLASNLHANKVLHFILSLDQCETHKKIKIALLCINLLLKEKTIMNLIQSLSQFDNELLESIIYIKIKDTLFTDFITKNIELIMKNYQERDYAVIKNLYMNFYKYSNKEIGFTFVNFLLKKHDKFEEILNYIAMCKGDGKPMEARNIIDKYLENNNFKNSQKAAFYYVIGRSYKDDFQRFNDSKYYFEESISLYSKQNENTNVDLVTNSLVSYYFKIGEFKKAYNLLLPIYEKVLDDKEGIFTSGDIEAIYNNMEIMKLVNNLPTKENTLQALTSWFPFYYQNTVAIRMVYENNEEKAIKILNDCLQITPKSDTYLVNAAILYNLYLLDGDESKLKKSKKICTEKGYTIGLNMIKHRNSQEHVLNTYTINGKHFWLCDKNVDILV